MTWLDPPLGHAAVIEGLWTAAKNTRLAHALGFDGPEGIGKYHAARWFAAGLLCAEGPGPPCGTCAPCKRVASGNHADLCIVDPEALGEERIRVDCIRRKPDSDSPVDPPVEEFLELKAHEGGFQVVILRDADRLNVNAQNALLKTLEEPRPNKVLVLESSRYGELMDTVQSRLLRVRFDRLNPEDSASVLESSGLEHERALRLSRWGGGAPGVAARLAAQGAEVARALIEDVLFGRRSALEAAAEVLGIEGRFPAKTPTAEARVRMRAFLKLGLDVFTDLVRATHGVPPEGLAHGDLFVEKALSARDLERLLDRWLDASQDVDRNLAPQAAVERALCALEDAAGPQATTASRSSARQGAPQT